MDYYIDEHLRFIVPFSEIAYYFHGFVEILPYFQDVMKKLGNDSIRIAQHACKNYRNQVIIHSLIYDRISLILSEASNIAATKRNDILLNRIQGMIYTLILCRENVFGENMTLIDSQTFPLTLQNVKRDYPNARQLRIRNIDSPVMRPRFAIHGEGGGEWSEESGNKRVKKRD